MATKHSKEVRAFTADERVTKLRDFEAQLFDAKMKKATGQLTDTALMRRIRKDVARIKTFQTQQVMAKNQANQKEAKR